MTPARVLQARHAVNVLFPLHEISPVVVAFVVERQLVLGVREVRHCQKSSTGIAKLNVHARRGESCA